MNRLFTIYWFYILYYILYRLFTSIYYVLITHSCFGRVLPDWTTTMFELLAGRANPDGKWTICIVSGERHNNMLCHKSRSVEWESRQVPATDGWVKKGMVMQLCCSVLSPLLLAGLMCFWSLQCNFQGGFGNCNCMSPFMFFFELSWPLYGYNYEI